jgi:hypothetical protein
MSSVEQFNDLVEIYSFREAVPARATEVHGSLQMPPASPLMYDFLQAQKELAWARKNRFHNDI